MPSPEVTTFRAPSTPYQHPPFFPSYSANLSFFFTDFLPLFLAIMADKPLDVLLKGESGRNTRGLLRILILCTVAAAAVSSRLFSVIRTCLLVIVSRQAIESVY